MSKKVELRIKDNEDAFRTFFGEEELNNENKKLYNLLVSSLVRLEVIGRIALLGFKGGITASIEFDGEDFFLTISDHTLYEYNDSPKTKMSKDRILHYLDYIGNVSLMEAQ